MFAELADSKLIPESCEYGSPSVCASALARAGSFAPPRMGLTQRRKSDVPLVPSPMSARSTRNTRSVQECVVCAAVSGGFMRLQLATNRVLPILTISLESFHKLMVACG